MWNNKMLFFIFFIIIINSDGRIINSIMDGVHEDMEGPIVSDLEGNIPGTTIGVFGQKDKDTYITYKNEKDDILFMYAPNCGSLYHALIATEDNGFRVFCNGDEIGFIKSRTINAKTATVYGNGIYKITIAQNEPMWAVNKIHNYGTIYNGPFEENGTLVPFTYELLSNEINVNDYFLFSGKKDNATLAIATDLNNGKEKTFDLIIRTKTPFFSIEASQGTVSTYKEIVGMPLLDPDEDYFSIAIVAEHNGWKIYFNGQEVHFFYDRFYKNGKFLNIRGINYQDNWTLLKFTHFFKE